jgi:hypothetical protein
MTKFIKKTNHKNTATVLIVLLMVLLASCSQRKEEEKVSPEEVRQIAEEVLNPLYAPPSVVKRN